MNHLTPGETNFGAADQVFPRLGNSVYRDADDLPPGFGPPNTPTSYNQTKGIVADADPRIISNMIVDQTATNPAAVEVSGGCPSSMARPASSATSRPTSVCPRRSTRCSRSSASSSTTASIW